MRNTPLGKLPLQSYAVSSFNRVNFMMPGTRELPDSQAQQHYGLRCDHSGVHYRGRTGPFRPSVCISKQFQDVVNTQGKNQQRSHDPERSMTPPVWCHRKIQNTRQCARAQNRSQEPRAVYAFQGRHDRGGRGRVFCSKKERKKPTSQKLSSLLPGIM